MICKRRRNKAYLVYIICNKTIKAKGLSQRFEEKRTGRPADVFNLIQKKRPNTVVNLKTDEAMESRRSYKEVRSRFVV